MDTPYRKRVYQNPGGFSLTHTVGSGAADSTLQYLHRNTGFLLICFLQGTGSVTCDDRFFPLEAGDMVLLEPMALYRCRVDDGVYHERLVLHIGQSLFRDAPFDCGALAEPFRQRAGTAGCRFPGERIRRDGADRLLSELWDLSRRHDSVSDVLAVCRLLELLALLGRLLPGGEEIAAGDPSVHPALPEILEYLHAHFREDLKLDTVAGVFNLHPSYLSHLFKAGMGTSLWNYVIRLRLNRFNDLIRGGGSIEQTCYQVGFQNYANFYRLYRKYMGITPREYQQQIRR